MIEISRICMTTATALVIVAALLSLIVMTAKRRAVVAPAKVAVAPDGSEIDAGEVLASAPAAPSSSGIGAGWVARRITELAFVLLTVAMVLRMFVVGHVPLSNQYEFAASFAWGVLGVFIYFDWRYRLRALALFVLPLVFGMLMYAAMLPSDPVALPPALQNKLLLPLHVITASIGYGAAAVASAAAVLYLLHPHVGWRGMPSRDLLDEIGYRAIIVTFPMLTIMNILGAIWANTAWGRYWGWDPKETAALFTWLIYGAYLHARVVRDWRGTKANVLLILGFLAVLFTFFGNYFFGGLHSYGG